MSTHANRVQMTVSGTPGTGTITLNAATTGYRSFASAYGGNATVDVLIVDGTAWEVARDCTYTNSGTTLTRGTLESSSTGSAISLTSSAVVSVIPTADWGNRVESLLRQVTPGGRLTLVSGVPVYAPTLAVAVSGQDTSADTITVTAHGWAVGTMVTSSATSGGLTAGTQYYVGNVTTNTVSLHTTVAAAVAGTSKVDITGAVSATITSSGVANSTLYYTPYVHDGITLWDGANWRPITFSETSLALSGLTASLPYDVFAYLSSGALAIELLAWTSDTARATDVTLQDGRYCKSGDKTRLLLGTIYATGTTTTEDSLQYRYVSNVYNQIRATMQCSASGTHTYNSTSWRNWNAATLEMACVLPFGQRMEWGVLRFVGATTSATPRAGIDLNTTTPGNNLLASQTQPSTTSLTTTGPINGFNMQAGKNYLRGVQKTETAATADFFSLILFMTLSC